jgi:hypothetical protein
MAVLAVMSADAAGFQSFSFWRYTGRPLNYGFT